MIGTQRRARTLPHLVALAAMACVVAACGGKAEGGAGGGKPGGRGQPMAFPVVVAVVEARDVTYAVRATGSVEAFERVQVTARVAGVVDAVRFVEGDNVKADQVLVEIDPARYRIAVQQAKAQLAKAQAAVADAKVGLERRVKANEVSPGTVREDEIEQFRTRVRTSEADVALAKANLDEAEVNLRDAFVRTPIGGSIETRTVQTGAYVQPGTVLATLLRREPLLVRFGVPEEDAARLKLGQRIEFEVRGGLRPFKAAIMHIPDSADANDRLVAITARVDDPDRRALRPGGFAQVKVPIASMEAPVVPQTAVRPSERGFLAFVVEEGKAKERVLQLGLRTDDGLVEVKGGVKVGEQLVVRGAEALRDGASVKVTGAGSPENQSGSGSKDVPGAAGRVGAGNGARP